MSFKRLFSGLLALIMTTGVLSVSVQAAAIPEIYIDAETPTDFEGNKITSLKGGDMLIVPINVSSTNKNRMKAVKFSINYDTNLLTPGVDGTKALDYYTENESQILLQDGTTTMMGMIKIISRRNALTQAPVYFTSDAFTMTEQQKGRLVYQFVGTDRAGYEMTDDCEFYAFFTVNDGVDLTKLHIDSSQSTLDDDPLGSTNYDGTVTKLNACAGAFKVTIDGSKVPADTWIRNVYAQQQGGQKPQEIQAVSGTGDDGTYVFPVRVQIAANGSAKPSNTVSFDIMADITATKDAEPTGQPQKIGSVNVSLDGTATDYADNSMYN